MYLIRAKYISCKLNEKKMHNFFAYNIIFLIIWFNLGKSVLNENNIHVDPDEPFICLPFFFFWKKDAYLCISILRVINREGSGHSDNI